MRRPIALSVMLICCALVGAGAAPLARGDTAAGAGAPRCSRATALALVRAHRLLRVGERLDQAICHDLTGDGRSEIAFDIFSGGTGGDFVWGVFVAGHRGYKLGLLRHTGGGTALSVAGRDLLVSNPIYGKSTPVCCPRAFQIQRWRSVHRRFKLVSSTRSRHRPPGGR